MTEKIEVHLDGKVLSIETGRMAKQADGAAVVRLEETMVLVSACSQREPRENLSFFPLTCDYREYTYAAGKIPGGFFKREGRPTEKEVLTSRLIDRPIRPLFPDGYACETQIVAMVMSADPETNPDIPALNGASAALALSDIPFPYPLGAVRVGRVDGRFVLNPSYSQLEESDLNLILSGSWDGITMVEAGMREVSEQVVVDAIEYGHKEGIRPVIEAIRELAGRHPVAKRTVEPKSPDPDLVDQVESLAKEKILEALHTPGKLASERSMSDSRKEMLDSISDEAGDKRTEAGECFNRLKERLFRERLLQDGRRPDGRSFDQVRTISSEVGLLPRAHGSALFTRGETQALVTATLGTGDDAQRLDLLTGESSKRFMLHYNFPPFSVGEVRFLRGPGRREIGHGALAERAVTPMLPSEEEFPYTVRVVSDILESNGSSSMATVCGAVMSLQDAGVPLKGSIAGIAMGLVKEGDDYAVLSDIAGFEDHYGDMDFKVAGSRNGITALQMDIKIAGVTRAIMEEALLQAREGRLHILDRMEETIAEPRPDISRLAPRIVTIKIPVKKIGGVIGPGGKMIRSIIDQTGVKIDIEDDGTVNIASTSSEATDKAIRIIEDLTATAEIGKTYLGTVMKVVDFGAFVEIFPGTEGLLHISEVAEHRIRDIHQEISNGDKMMVKVLNIDDNNKIRLSRRAVLREQQGVRERPRSREQQGVRERPRSRERQGDRRGRRRQRR